MFMRGKERLYIGKAASLRDRAKSYFGDDILKTRGLHIANMVSLASTVKFFPTDSTLEALLFENKLIKKYRPCYNTKEKDDKSYNYVVITKELYPRVLVVRGKDLSDRLPTTNYKLQAVLGPFPQETLLREAMKIIRKIFPYRDTCKPCKITFTQDDGGRISVKCKPCFNRQLGLCPGVCDGKITSKEYKKIISHIKLFFRGRKSSLLKNLNRDMKSHSKELEFEKANQIKKTIFALRHIKDILLIKDTPNKELTDNVFRIEAYDVSHMGGHARVGVMTVIEDGAVNKNEYRTFKLAKNIIDDTLGLEEMLTRRLKHKEWRLPDLIVVDGGTAQKNTAEKILSENGFSIACVAVVKDERHRPREILGDREAVDNRRREILLSNSEAHRFAVAYHRKTFRGTLKASKNKDDR